MAEGGFIKLSRKILGWDYHDEPVVFTVWIHLLLLANWEDKRAVKRGEVLITQDLLAHMCGISRTTVIRCLKKLEESGEIKISANNKRTKITIIKYSLYQNLTTSDTTDDTTSDTTSDTTDDTAYLYKRKKEVKKERNKEKSLKETESFTPPTADQVREYAEKDGLSLDIDSFLDYYQNKDWIVSGEKCRDWRYLVRSWVRKDQEFSKGKKTKKKENLPDWYSADPKRSSGSGEKLSADELKAAQEKLKRMGKAKGGQ